MGILKYPLTHSPNHLLFEHKSISGQRFAPTCTSVLAGDEFHTNVSARINSDKGTMLVEIVQARVDVYQR